MKSKMTQTDGEIHHVLDWKNQYCENDRTTQSNLQIQCNPYKITNGIFFLFLFLFFFYKTRTKSFKIFMETQKTPNSHSNLEGKKMELED